MSPSSTVHFSFPTSTQLVRSLPLNSFTHCSPGCGARLRGGCAHKRTGTANSSKARFIVISLAQSLHVPARAIVALDVLRGVGQIGELHLLRVPLERGFGEARGQRPEQHRFGEGPRIVERRR